MAYEILKKQLSPREQAKAKRPQVFHAVEVGKSWAMCGLLARKGWEVARGETVECDKCQRALQIKATGGRFP